MKKALAVILFFLYVIPSMGINISVHYCSGKFSSVSIGSNYVSKCGCGSKKMKKECCQDQQFSFNIKYEQYKPSEIDFDFFKSFTSCPLAFIAYSCSFQPLVGGNSSYNAYHPPTQLKQSLYILNQVFRI